MFFIIKRYMYRYLDSEYSKGVHQEYLLRSNLRNKGRPGGPGPFDHMLRRLKILVPCVHVPVPARSNFWTPRHA